MIIEEGSRHLSVVHSSERWRDDYVVPCACVKNNMCFSVHPHIPYTEVHVINSPVAVRIVQGRSRELACVFTVIDATKLDTGRAVRVWNFKVQGEALNL